MRLIKVETYKGSKWIDVEKIVYIDPIVIDLDPVVIKPLRVKMINGKEFELTSESSSLVMKTLRDIDAFGNGRILPDGI